VNALQAFPAPAKLNLMLRVLGRRADGYHLLQTIFRFVDYGDEVGLRVREDGAIRRLRDVPGIATDDDLSVRAARLLQTATGTKLGADIELTKRLPPGGGLGGGSSDAATVLIALNHLWRTGLGRQDLQALGLRLGADVPVFVCGENAVGEGIGEVLTPVSLPPAWYLVLVPPVAVATSAVFAHPELKRDSKPIKIQGFSVVSSPDAMGNDLQDLVCRLYPEVARHLEWLRQHGEARMTGSGACVFAAFGTEPAARAVLSRMPRTMRGFVARGLDRHPLRELAG
jgi:4-diphosphocytidyl-2-C-methyl-D-erythritol kinase